MTTTSEMKKAIEGTFAQQVRKGCGAVIEATHRGGDDWTVSGVDAEVRKAVRFLTANVSLRVESVVHDDEIGESFAYMTGC